MHVEKVYTINDDYLMVPCHSPDTNSLIIRAIETETIQTENKRFYLLDRNANNGVVSLFGLSAGEISALRTDISNLLREEIIKANTYLNEFGVNIDVDMELLFPHETSTIVEVPTISSYEDLFEVETLDYLTNAGGVVTENDDRKSYINAALVWLKDSTLWNALDVITILAQSAAWDPLKINTNLKVGVPGAWKNSYFGANGNALTTGIKLDGTSPGSFISLGYQPLAPDFNNHYPDPQFTKDESSITVKIDSATGSGTIFRRSGNQDLLSYDAGNEILYVNLTGSYDDTTVLEYSFGGNINGIWTINRVDASTISIWKDGVQLTSLLCDSHPFEELGCYSSLGYGANYDNALDAIYQFAAIGRKLTNLEIVELHDFINNYLTGLPTNNVTVFP